MDLPSHARKQHCHRLRTQNIRSVNEINSTTASITTSNNSDNDNNDPPVGNCQVNCSLNGRARTIDGYTEFCHCDLKYQEYCGEKFEFNNQLST
ncbi:unnamed protein product [Didymodactylos carnosus]|uniref:Uncharacterized protein n=2 Tax=Didymodactylos carnosus TaxID=1234261 RepID=A0A815WWM5_9BILA|nr:unnamed protein product [Didymodactylos carnosus]CAF4407930.1 unnamed protein product [Didymodactylos carnosus]